MKILFMCVANSARSQLAEGLAKNIFGPGIWIESAGSDPKVPNPLAVEALSEIGIDISKHYSKSIGDLRSDFLTDLNYVITLCAEEVCPVMPTRTAQKLHWPFADPASHSGTAEERLQSFRDTRDAIQLKLIEFKSVVDGKAESSHR